MKDILLTVTVLISFSMIGFSQIHTSKIEIYLLKDFVVSESETKRFAVDINDIRNTPIIRDSEILGYDTLTHEFSIDTSVCNKLKKLQPSLSIGIQFALTVDQIPVLTGYFWNPLSSFGCDWYTINTLCGDKLKINKGLPEHLNSNLPELRNDERLIYAILHSNRLKN